MIVQGKDLSGNEGFAHWPMFLISKLKFMLKWNIFSKENMGKKCLERIQTKHKHKKKEF